MVSDEIPGEELEDIEKPTIGILFTEQEARDLRIELLALQYLERSYGDINFDFGNIFPQTAKVLLTLTAGLVNPLSVEGEANPDE